MDTITQMAASPEYEINDSKSVEDNIAAFMRELTAADPVLGGMLSAKLPEQLSGSCDRAEVLEALMAILEQEDGP